MQEQLLREHLLELLDGKSAHIDIPTALEGFPIEHINTRSHNCPHTAWELLEHIRTAQSDILKFSRSPAHTSPAWPEGYWPKQVAGEEDWQRSVEQILADLETIREMVRNEAMDLSAPIRHGDDQSILREVLLVADHNAYHLGQLVLVRRMLEACSPEE